MCVGIHCKHQLFSAKRKKEWSADKLSGLKAKGIPRAPASYIFLYIFTCVYIYGEKYMREGRKVYRGDVNRRRWRPGGPNDVLDELMYACLKVHSRYWNLATFFFLSLAILAFSSRCFCAIPISAFLLGSSLFPVPFRWSTVCVRCISLLRIAQPSIL